MHGKRMKRSPLHGDVDTAWADKVYTNIKVDEELDKSGHYKEGETRGKEKPFGHYGGQTIGGGDVFLGELND